MIRRDRLIAEIDEATGRLVATAGRLGDADLRAPSLLPGWSRGHVLSHLAAQAASLERLLTWAQTGVEQAQYASRAARAAEIEAGASRSADELLAAVAAQATHFAGLIAAQPDEVWSAPIRPITGEVCAAERILTIRLREVEVHDVDLAAGYGFADIPRPSVDVIIADVVGTCAGRMDGAGFTLRDSRGELVASVGEGAAIPAISGERGALLAWLTGRSDGSDLQVGGRLPTLSAWI